MTPVSDSGGTRITHGQGLDDQRWARRASARCTAGGARDLAGATRAVDRDAPAGGRLPDVAVGLGRVAQPVRRGAARRLAHRRGHGRLLVGAAPALRRRPGDAHQRGPPAAGRHRQPDDASRVHRDLVGGPGDRRALPGPPRRDDPDVSVHQRDGDGPQRRQGGAGLRRLAAGLRRLPRAADRGHHCRHARGRLRCDPARRPGPGRPAPRAAGPGRRVGGLRTRLADAAGRTGDRPRRRGPHPGRGVDAGRTFGRHRRVVDPARLRHGPRHRHRRGRALRLRQVRGHHQGRQGPRPHRRGDR
ncbi:hypothetical protein [Ornithinimicrobium kibberense]|uniref:hypothetical protein n=1 Tax=Ornithinimicrobium kibberense TaxID=282060 RepID=UPI00361012A8